MEGRPDRRYDLVSTRITLCVWLDRLLIVEFFVGVILGTDITQR